jgi:competence protein ComFB
MAFNDKYDFENLKNEAEILVIAELGRQLEPLAESVCQCNDCVLDMAAKALNSVRPLYRVTLLGTLYTSHAMEDKAYAASIKDAVSKAIEKVKKNPSHSG